ncbi:TraB domain-containing protein [Actinidia chinensis var. chinensis]|uniref:TraB domain-containing protein n=1 Tax=Actinidia chinensis var. chinensis TaxID=1590841 RepID=A0A2R6QY31_ACTCC|nr:TraB domain-containing protein [Actinidia chinensis var. chinensis]
MVYPFICGSASLNHQLEDDRDEANVIIPSSPPPRPSKQRRLSSFCRSKASKNPYSDRGLDKFSALLAELDDKRQRIYTQAGADEISFVRFVYSSGSNDCKPIVVRAKDHKQLHQEKAHGAQPVESIISEESSSKLGNEVDPLMNDRSGSGGKRKRFELDFLRVDVWRRPYFYLGMVVILILVLLAVFGKSFAILCTSLGWYLVPSMKGGSSSSSATRPRKKKDYAKTEKKKIVSRDGLASPTSVITGDDFSPRPHGHRKSF